MDNPLKKTAGALSDQLLMSASSKKPYLHRKFKLHKCQPVTQNDDFACLNSAPGTVVVSPGSQHFWFSKWRWTAVREGQHEHEGQRLTSSPTANHVKKKKTVLTLLSLIPMKITGWQGGCYGCFSRPLTHRQLQVIHARCHAAVVCGNCKLLLKSPGEWL